MTTEPRGLLTQAHIALGMLRDNEAAALELTAGETLALHKIWNSIATYLFGGQVPPQPVQENGTTIYKAVTGKTLKTD